nr:hypothetical protein BaRGS_029337 [Batillaria attramentaria]
MSAEGDGIKSLTTLWETDFHNIHMIEPEFMRWCTKWSMEMKKEEPIIPSSLTEAIKTCNKALFPNLHQLMRLIMTLPITTSEWLTWKNSNSVTWTDGKDYVCQVKQIDEKTDLVHVHFMAQERIPSGPATPFERNQTLPNCRSSEQLHNKKEPYE